MNIFLNTRVIRFTRVHPESPLPTDLITVYTNADKLLQVWKDFQRYEKYLALIVVDCGALPDFFNTNITTPLDLLKDYCPAFKAFLSFFKYIPAAGGFVKNEKDEMLFIHRLGLWDLPKGKIEKRELKKMNIDDAARVAAVREVMEETGLTKIEVLGQLPSTWHIYEHKEKMVLKQTYWFSMLSGSEFTLKPQTSEGIFLVKWIPKDDLHCVLGHTYHSIRELVVPALF
jgi:ADP-ribose pyrophosphatase YjhB (NUDIX family)